MSLQQIFPVVAMETALTEVFAMSVVELVIPQSVQLIHQCLVELAHLFDQQEVNSCYVLGLLTETIY